MGCQKSIPSFQSVQGRSLSSPTEELQIQEYELILLDTFYHSVLDPLKEHSLGEAQNYMKKVEDPRLVKNLSYFDSAFKFLLSYNLMREMALPSKLQLILNLFETEKLSSAQVSHLIDCILEISTRIIPFMFFNHKSINECQFFYYMTVLARAKKHYRLVCLEEIFRDCSSIEKPRLYDLVLRNNLLMPLLNTSFLRAKLWEFSFLKPEDTKRTLRQTENIRKKPRREISFLVTDIQENI